MVEAKVVLRSEDGRTEALVELAIRLQDYAFSMMEAGYYKARWGYVRVSVTVE